MCLTLNDSVEPAIATEDIIVYKFVKTVGDVMFAPYQWDRYPKLGTLIKSPLLVDGLEYYDPEEDWAYPTVEEGLHSFAHLRQCRAHARSYDDSNYAYVQCIIPKGATYYKGTFGNGNTSYASDQLIMVKRFGKFRAWWRVFKNSFKR